MAKVNFYLKELIQESLLKNLASSELESEKNSSECKFWETSTNMMILKKNLQDLQSEHEELQKENQNSIALLKEISMQHAYWDQKINAIQKLTEELYQKEEDQKKMFHKNMAKISQKYKDFDEIFKEDNIKTEINDLSSEIEKSKSSITGAQEELEKAKKLLEHKKIYDIPDLKDITGVVQKESLELFGDPLANQKKMADFKTNVEYMQKQLEELN